MNEVLSAREDSIDHTLLWSIHQTLIIEFTDIFFLFQAFPFVQIEFNVVWQLMKSFLAINEIVISLFNWFLCLMAYQLLKVI